MAVSYSLSNQTSSDAKSGVTVGAKNTYINAGSASGGSAIPDFLRSRLDSSVLPQTQNGTMFLGAVGVGLLLLFLLKGR